MPLGSLGFGASKGRTSRGQSVWQPQADALQNLYSGATDFFNQGSPFLGAALGSGAQAIGNMSGYTGQAMPALGGLLGGGHFGGGNYDVSGANPMAQGQGQGFDTYRGMMNPQGNPYLNAMFGAGAGNMTQNWAQNIMPQITNEASMSGGYGGSRQGIAEGLSAQGLMDSVGDFGANLYGNAYSGDMNRALAAAQGYNQDMLSGIDMNRMIGQGADQTTLQALGQGQNAMNLGFGPANMYNQLYNMQWQPYQQYGNILGRPTVLGWGQGETDQIQGSFGLT